MLSFREYLEEVTQRRIDIHGELRYINSADKSLKGSVDPKAASQVHHAAIRSYTASSGSINRQLRTSYQNGVHPIKVLSRKNHQLVSGIDNAIANSRGLSSRTHVYHGTSVDPSKSVEDGTWTNTSYISTSIDPHHAAYFSHGDVPHMIHFHLAKGSKHGVYADGLERTHHSDVGREYEYILKHGQKWKYHGSERVQAGSGEVVMHHMSAL